MRRMAIALICYFWVQGAAVAAVDPSQLVRDARKQIGVTTHYDPAYRQLGYPGGDVPMSTGVCTDVVVRALRAQNLDLQRLVHEDMRANFARYPQNWGLRGPDRNIDHRRVPNLMRYFEREGWSLGISQQASAYQAGDIVAWDLGSGLLHIGVVSDRETRAGVPLIIHNIGSGAREEDLLQSYQIIGHYRLPGRSSRASRPQQQSSTELPYQAEAAGQQRPVSGGVGAAIRTQGSD